MSGPARAFGEMRRAGAKLGGVETGLTAPTAQSASAAREAPTRRSGTTELRTLVPGTRDYRRWIDISADAYPISKLDTVAQRDAAFEEQRDLGERQPEHRLVGAYRDGRLVGGMRVYDFFMCVRGASVFTGGIGSVAVGFEHKRRGVARDLVCGFLDEYRERGAALSLLYPFRPDFYTKLGFGYGSKMNQYRIALDALPAHGAREHVRQLGPGDLAAFLAVYARVADRTNGLLRREVWRAELRLAGDAFRTFGYVDAQGLGGYLTVEIKLGKNGSMNRNELYLHELIYETPAALAALLAFARSLRDQFATLIVNTQDPDFHFVPLDPRNGSDRSLYPPVYHETNAQGVGVMYRLLDVARLVDALAGCEFGDLAGTVRIDLADAVLPANAGAYTVRFAAGRAQLAERGATPDVDVAIDVADLSALVMGSVRLRSLVAYGRALVSKPHWLRPLDAAFDTAAPVCLTRF